MTVLELGLIAVAFGAVYMIFLAWYACKGGKNEI
jgi:hypothetical protein